jgi:mono/diheme cytochrome c family protein
MRLPRRLAAALALLPGLSAAGVAAASPAQDYVLNCMGCHGPEGQGVPGRVPPLGHSLARFMRTPAGRHYVLSVPGAANSALSDAALAAVLNWLAQTYDPEDLGPTVALFTPAEVAANRHSPLLSVLAARAAVVRELQTTGIAPPGSY